MHTCNVCTLSCAWRVHVHAQVLYMEDDFWPSPDLLDFALFLRAQREAHCPECVGSIVGEHPRDWTVAHAGPRMCTPP